jgi:hypothetical protein
MPSTLDQRMQTAIAAIETFLGSADLARTSTSQLRELSVQIQKARAARRNNHWHPADPQEEALHARYREALRKLRLRLADIETELATERERCLREQETLTRTRHWHHSFSRTQ